MKCLLIYNPVSGKSKKFIKMLPYVEKGLKTKYKSVDIVATNYAGEAIEIANNACGKYDLVIVSGGDGTFSEVLKGIGENNNAPTLAYIPSGSCGDIANNHKIPHNIKKALKVILKGEKKQIDLCKINDSYFSYIAGIGTYTAGVYNADQKLKIKIGRAAYYLEAVKESFNVKHYCVNLNIDGTIYQYNDAILVLVLNSISVGGFKNFNNEARFDDGKVDVIVVRKDTFNTPFNIWKLFVNGVKKYINNDSVKIYSCSKVEIEVKDKVLWNVDGDKSTYQNIKIECLKKKISMIVGK